MEPLNFSGKCITQCKQRPLLQHNTMQCKQSYQHPSKRKQHVVSPSSLPSPDLTYRYRLASHQKSSLIFTSLELDNCSAGAVKDTPERKTNRMWCEWRQGGRGGAGGEKNKKQRPSLAGFEVAHVLLASAQPVPWIHATCINSWLTRLTCSRIRQTQIEEW